MKTVQAHDFISHADLEDLAGVEEDLCVSLLMPSHPSAPESHQDPVRLRNLLDEAEARLLQRKQKRADVERLLKPTRALLADDFFWTHQSDGLAIYLTDNSLRKFRLPAPFEQSIEVARQFLVTPLVSLLRPGHAFYILAVSQNSCRLLRGTQFQVEEVQSEELPQDLQSALGRWRERTLNFHSQPRNPTGPAIYHKHEEDDKTIDLTAYLRQVADLLRPMLHNQSAPLLFAGVEELFPIFQEVYGEKGLIAERVAGNPDKLTPEQLHQRARPIVDSHHQRQSARVWENYHAARNLERATHELGVILPACRDGLVETLFIGDGTRHFGTFDTQANQIRKDGEAGFTVDLLNLAAVHALRTGANVSAVPPTDIPQKASAAAILRVPVSAVQTPEETA